MHSAGAVGKVSIQAGLHADEAPGYLVAARLLELLHRADAAGEILGEIVVVPVANPIGLAQWGTDTVQGRFDDSDHINFNRRNYDLVEDLTARLQGLLGVDGGENVALIRKYIGEILIAKEPTTKAEALRHTLLSLSFDADIVLDLHCDLQGTGGRLLHLPGKWQVEQTLYHPHGKTIAMQCFSLSIFKYPDVRRIP